MLTLGQITQGVLGSGINPGVKNYIVLKHTCKILIINIAWLIFEAICKLLNRLTDFLYTPLAKEWPIYADSLNTPLAKRQLTYIQKGWLTYADFS